MADNYYIDTDGSGTSPYDTWAKAANTNTLAQTVLDTAVAGETIHARGSLTLTAQLDIDQHEGDMTDGVIKVIGYNAAGVNDGTRFIIDCNDAVAAGIYNNSMNYWYFENIEVKNAVGGDGFTGEAAQYNTFINCCANNNDARGFNTYNLSRSLFIRCVAYSNTSDGFGPGSASQGLIFCRSRDNGQSGFDITYMGGATIGCITDHNGNDGFEGHNVGNVIFNCVSDANTDNGYIPSSVSTYLLSLIGCRITNHSGAGDIGVDANGRILVYGWNYYQNNDGNNIQNDTIAYEILDDGAGTDAEDQGDTESGYVNQDDPEDYNLTDEATSRRTAIQIPME